jgi:hypothetical protein
MPFWNSPEFTDFASIRSTTHTALPNPWAEPKALRGEARILTSNPPHYANVAGYSV